MPVRTYKLIQLVGISDKGFDEASRNAVKQASKSLRNVSWFEVVEQRGKVKDGKVVEYQVKLNVAFKLEGSD